MMRLALFHNLPAGGAKRHTYEQVRELARRGYEIHEFTPSTSERHFMAMDEYLAASRCYELDWHPLQPFPIRGMGPFVHLCQNRRNLAALERLSRQIASDIDAGGFDLVFVKDCMFTIAPFVLKHLTTPTAFYLHTIPQREQFAEPRAVATTPHPSWLAWPMRVPSRLNGALLRRHFSENIHRATRVLTNSHFSRELMLFNHQITSFVVYPGVDTRTFRPQSASASDYVLSVGTFHPIKGHWFVIEALGLLPAAIRPRLIIASASDDDEQAKSLKAFAATHGVSAATCSIHDSREMAELYAGALALAFAPILEPLGLVALEAMACGTPVVGVKEGGLRETVRDGETGLLVERDPPAFAEALQAIIQNRALRQLLGRQARERIESYWTWRRAVDDLERQFGAVVEARP